MALFGDPPALSAWENFRGHNGVSRPFPGFDADLVVAMCKGGSCDGLPNMVPKRDTGFWRSCAKTCWQVMRLAGMVG